MLFDVGTGRVGLARGLSSCVPLRRTRWRLPRLGYLGDEESRSKILDNQGRGAAVVSICYGVGGGVVSPRRVQGWEGTRILSPFSDRRLVRVSLSLELLQLGFFLRLRAFSPYMYLAVYYLYHLQMSRSSLCPSQATNRYAHLFPSLPALRNLGSGEAKDGGH
jgi:hypothetical protein